jgi:pilus assembly protein CpaC
MKKIQWAGFVGMIVLVIVGITPVPFAHAESVQVSVGEAVTIPGENVTKIAIADPSIADVIPLSDKELSVIGKKPGVTTLSIVKSDGSATERHRIEVGNDTAAETIREMIGSKDINVRAIGDALVLDGKVNDEIEAQRAAQIAAAYKPQVVNLLEIKKPRQVRVRTRIAEVNTEAIKNIGLQWFGPQGQVQYAMHYGSINGSIIHGFIPTASEAGAEGRSFDANSVSLSVLLDLLITKSYARILSEPTLVTFSGKEASFLVGQEIPIVQQLPNSFTVEFKEVGVRMKIKPTADSENRINTVIHAEVSQVIGVGANSIPIIGAKTADTTLQANDGQTIVIGGLLENNINRDVLRKLPWLGDIPIIGLMFRDKQFDQAKREVLFFMTPEVIKDVDADTAAAAHTPGMQNWVATWNKGKMIPATDKKDDWGLHNPDHLGFPHDENSEKTAAKPAAKPAPTVKPAAAAKPTAAPAAKPAKAERPVVVSPTVAAPTAEKTPVTKPAPPAPTEEPSTNFSPARPTGE